MNIYISLLGLFLFGACAGTDDLRGVAAKTPLDCAVLVSGGAYFSSQAGARGTFYVAPEGEAADGPDSLIEAIPFESIVDVLERGNVFQRVAAESDPQRRVWLRDELLQQRSGKELADFLRTAREGGFDLLVLIEELRDGPVENQGTNSRWPVTFVTWILLGVGALIPDRTFESRATLRVSLRDLQTGAELDNLLLTPGPVELALTERSDLLGVLTSIIVPPFWVGDDSAAITDAVRNTSERRLLLSLARDLKSGVVRRRIAEASAADIQLRSSPAGPLVVVESRQSLSVASIDGAVFLDPQAVVEFGEGLLASRSIQGARFRYEMALPQARGRGTFQVKVATLRGGVASATFTLDSVR